MTNSNTFNNAYGYGRHSTAKQDDKFSEPRQRKLIEQTATNLNLPLIGIYYDAAVRATNGDNLQEGSEWNKLKRQLRPNDVVLVENTDRLTRQDLEIYLREVKDVCINHGASILLTGEGQYGKIINKTNYQGIGSIVTNVVAHQAEKDRSDRSKLAMADLREKHRSGKWTVTGWHPFWIIRDAETQTYKKGDPKKIALVKRIFELYDGGYNANGIARLLTKEGVEPLRKNTKVWRPSTITYLLTSPTVIGKVRSGDEHPKLYPAIINDDLFYEVQRKLDARRKSRGRVEYPHRWLFRNLLICSRCGNKMVGHCPETDDDGNLVRPYYNCTIAVKCAYTSIRADHFEKAMKMMLSKSDIMCSFVNKEKIEPTRLNELNGRLIEIQKKEKNLAEAIAENKSNVLLEKLREVEKEDRLIQRQIATEEATIRASQPITNLVEDYRTKYQDKWDDPNSRLQIRELLRELIEKVVVDAEKQRCTVHFLNNACNPVTIDLIDKTKYSINGMEFLYEERK